MTDRLSDRVDQEWPFGPESSDAFTPRVIVRFGAKRHPASSSAGVALHPPAPIGPVGTRVGFRARAGEKPDRLPRIRYPSLLPQYPHGVRPRLSSTKTDGRPRRAKGFRRHTGYAVSLEIVL